MKHCASLASSVQHESYSIRARASGDQNPLSPLSEDCPLASVVQKALFVIWDHIVSRVAEGDLWEVSLTIGGSDHDGVLVFLLPIDSCVLGRREKGHTRGAFLGICGRYPYSNEVAKIQGIDGCVKMVCYGLRILGSRAT